MTTGRHRVFGSKKPANEFLLVDGELSGVIRRLFNFLEEEEHVSQLKSFPKEQKDSNNTKSSSSSPVDNGTVWGSTEDGWGNTEDNGWGNTDGNGWENASGWPDDKVESEDKSAWDGNAQKPRRESSNKGDKTKGKIRHKLKGSAILSSSRG